MKVNGEICTLNTPIRVTDYLTANGYNTGRIAVELNGEILPKTLYDTTQLCDTDTLEIVHFVGGG